MLKKISRYKAQVISSVTFVLKDIHIIAEDILKEISGRKIILMQGELGVGKTTLARCFVQTLLKGNIEVTSPTFNIVNTYSNHEIKIAHFDLYRVRSIAELLEIGIYEFLKDYFCIIEWPEIIEEIALINCVKIKLNYSKELSGRRAVVSLLDNCDVA